MKKKSLSAKKTIPNKFDFIKILKNRKIFETYKEFAKEFESLNFSNKIAVAISGGPDSIALSFLISCYRFKKNPKIQPFFYLVDHGLRQESSKEAKLVKYYFKQKKMNLKILKWTGKKPISNLQGLARQIRYSLLFNQCKKYKISTILTAHHQDDLYETFFSRLLRGSGTEGLASFAEKEKKFVFRGNSIIILRPLIRFNKEKLKYIARKVFNFYVDDPSNEMEKFQRVRLRKLISKFKNEGLDFNKLTLTLNNLASSNKTINDIVDKNISENVNFQKNKYLINFLFFLYPNEIVFRSLSVLIKKISKKDYPPRGKKLSKLIKELKTINQFKTTLGGTIIEKIQNSVVLTQEKTKKR